MRAQSTPKSLPRLPSTSTPRARMFDVIEQEPGRLREVTGIRPKRAERIRCSAR
jgi:hypothetical protein